MWKRGWLAMLMLAGCGDDALPTGQQQGAIDCAKVSVAACSQHNSCQLLYDDAGAAHCGEERIGMRSCGVLTIDECALDPRCETIAGRRFDAALQCVNAPEPVGCQDRGRACPAAVLYATAGGKTYELSRGCTPKGWQNIQPTAVPQQTWSVCDQDSMPMLKDGGVSGDAHVPSCAAPGTSCVTAYCETLDLPSCTSDARCRVLRARTFDQDMKCRGDELELGCTEAAITCDPIPTLGFDAQGRSYLFEESGSGCIPPSFTQSGKVDLYALCNASSVEPCAGLTYKDCDQHPECRSGLGCPVTFSPTGPSECEQRSVADCKLDTKCASVAAQPLDAACNAQELVGCITLGRTCHGQTAYAKKADGRLFELASDDCLPSGFTSVGFTEIPQPGAGVCPVSYAKRCSAMGVARCQEDPGCEPIVGAHLDLNAHCVGATTAVACAAKSETRYEGTVIAADRQGERYRLLGYRYVPELDYYKVDGPLSAATAALLAWPTCSK